MSREGCVNRELDSAEPCASWNLAIPAPSGAILRLNSLRNEMDVGEHATRRMKDEMDDLLSMSPGNASSLPPKCCFQFGAVRS